MRTIASSCRCGTSWRGHIYRISSRRQARSTTRHSELSSCWRWRRTATLPVGAGQSVLPQRENWVGNLRGWRWTVISDLGCQVKTFRDSNLRVVSMRAIPAVCSKDGVLHDISAMLVFSSATGFFLAVMPLFRYPSMTFGASMLPYPVSIHEEYGPIRDLITAPSVITRLSFHTVPRPQPTPQPPCTPYPIHRSPQPYHARPPPSRTSSPHLPAPTAFVSRPHYPCLCLLTSSPTPQSMGEKGRGIARSDACASLAWHPAAHASYQPLPTRQPEILKGNRSMTDLHLNIQNTDPPLLRHIIHGLDARPIMIPPKLCMFNETLLVHELQELVLRRKVVFAAILLTGAWRACRVCVLGGECGGKGRRGAWGELTDGKRRSQRCPDGRRRGAWGWWICRSQRGRRWRWADVLGLLGADCQCLDLSERWGGWWGRWRYL